MTTPIRVLLVEDSPDDAELMVLELRRGGFAPSWQRVETAEEMRAALDAGTWDVILSDYSLPHFGAGAALELVREVAPDVPFLVVSGAIGEEVAVEAMRAGANDYFLKSSLTRLGPAVRRELRETENRWARRRAEQTAYRLAAVVESSSDAIIATALEGVITSWNPGAERLYGYAEAEALGKDISLLVPATQRESDVPEDHADMTRRLWRGERIPAYEAVRVRKDGRRVDVLVSISPIWGLDGRVLGASVIAHDVSQRKRAERFLAAEHATTRILAESGNLQEASPRLLRALAEALRWEVVVLWQVDRQGNVLRHIHTWRSPWSQRRSLDDPGPEAFLEPGVGVAGRAWSRREAVWEPHVTIPGKGSGGPGMTSAGTRAAFALPMQRQSEVVGVIEFCNPEIRQPDEPLLAALDNIATQISQVSERWQKEAALFESEQRFRQMAENTREVFRLADARTGSVLYVSPAYEAIWGRSRQSLSADTNSWLEAVHPEDRARVAAFDRGLSNGEAEQEYRIVMPDASVRWIWDRRYPVRGPQGEIERFVSMAEDITRRKNAEMASFQLASIVLNSEDAIIGEDLEGRITTWNPAAERLYGYASGEVLGRPISLLAPEGQHEVMLAILERVKRGEGVAPAETVRRRKDGTLVDVAVSVSPIRNAAGRIVGVAKIVRDVTERKRADRALARDALILASVRDAVTMTDLDGVVTYWNEGAARLFGWAAEEMLGRPMIDRVPEAGRAATLSAIQSIAGGQEFAGEWLDYRKDGSRVWIDARVGRMTDAAGVPVGILGIAHDISDRKQAESERDRLLEQLRLQIERLPLAYLLSGPDFRYTRWNPAAERLFGFTEAEILGKHPFEVIVPQQTRSQVADIFARLRAGDMDAHGTGENVTKDGRNIVCEWYNTPLMDPDGTVQGILSLAQDITDRRQLEDQFRQAQKMEAVGRLAGGVAHDFNNLLTVINGYGEIVMNGLRPGDPAMELVREIRKAGERATGLTRQLLAFSRKTVLEPKILDLNAQIREMEKLLLRLIGEDIDLVARLSPDLGPVKADAGQLEQAVVNLCVNARDAMPQGGKLTIETHKATLDDAYARDHPDVQPGSYALLAVSDTGHGMDATTQARIFEPFFTTKEQGKGTGLGLAMIYGFVKQSGGHVAVYSEPGRGTTFKIYLPHVQGAVASGKPQPGLAVLPKGSETMLLVEDEGGVRALARHLLQTCGYTVLEAGYGKEALRVAERHAGPIHLLITDVVMPQGMGGRQVAEAVRALHPEARVLFVSGYTDDAVVRHGILEANTNFLQKPFTPASLTQKVREVLDQAQPAAGAGSP